jgi:hypothetical protein
MCNCPDHIGPITFVSNEPLRCDLSPGSRPRDAPNRKACGEDPAGLAVVSPGIFSYRGELWPTSRPPIFGL